MFYNPYADQKHLEQVERAKRNKLAKRRAKNKLARASRKRNR